MRYLGVLALLLCASAQASLADKINACATHQDKTRRLQCFDRIAIYVMIDSVTQEGKKSDAMPSPKPLVKAGSWQLKESVSVMDDSKSLLLSLESMKSVNTMFGPAKPVLGIMCQARSGLSLYVHFGAYLGIGNINVQTRLDKLPAHDDVWQAATSGQAVFVVQKVEQFIYSLVRHGSLLVATRAVDGTELIADFNVEGLAQQIKPLEEMCSR